MQTDDEQILQISLRQDEVDQLEKLFKEAMEDPVIESPKAEDNPRDRLHSSLSEPTLPKLGHGDIEVTVVTSMESDTAAKEIVDNKLIRIAGEGQLSETSTTTKYVVDAMQWDTSWSHAQRIMA